MRAITNPPNPYLKYSAEYVGEPPPTKLEVFEEIATRSMISKSNMPGMGERFIVNCYRGCMHACTYCFARQYHEYLGYGAGTDFETKIVAKIKAPEVLRQELKRTRQKIHHLEFSFATDPYLPLEANYELTRRCLKVCSEFRMPVSIITKSPLVTRDLDIFADLLPSIFFSIPFLTTERSKPFELYAPIPDVRFRAMETLAKQGVKVGIGIAPVILGYNDSEIPQLLEKARDHGASRAFMCMLHFDTDSIRDYFVQKIEEKIPTKAGKVLNQIRREHGENLRPRNFKERTSGNTKRWEMAAQLFQMHYKRLGFESRERSLQIVEKAVAVQQSLF